MDSEQQSRKLKKVIVSKGLRSREMIVSYPALSPTVPPFWGGVSSKMAEWRRWVSLVPSPLPAAIFNWARMWSGVHSRNSWHSSSLASWPIRLSESVNVINFIVRNSVTVMDILNKSERSCVGPCERCHQASLP